MDKSIWKKMMINRLLSILLIILSIMLLNSIEYLILTSILAGIILRNEELSFIHAMLISFFATLIAFMLQTIYMPSIELFSKIFFGISTMTLVSISILFTSFTIALLMKSSYEISNWRKA